PGTFRFDRFGSSWDPARLLRPVHPLGLGAAGPDVEQVGVGFSLSLQLFYGATPALVAGLYKGLLRRRGEVSDGRPQPGPEDQWEWLSYGLNVWGSFPWRKFELFDCPGWVSIDPDVYLEEYPWIQDDVTDLSGQLQCVGVLLFCLNGEFWGYALSDRGKRVDQFAQDPCQTAMFPSLDTRGNAGLLASLLPHLDAARIQPYLVQTPSTEEEFEQLDVPVHADDEFTRFSQGAVLDFARALGVPLAVEGSRVVHQAPRFREFWWKPGL
ncbi:MAG: hypothetical protein AB1758_08815, partial [Candidatus Eremiobacterota bacterium]